MGSVHDVKSNIQLGCGCRVWVSQQINIGDDWICFEHGITKRVGVVSWHLRCQKCRFSRKDMINESIRSQGMAIKHAFKTGHTVRLWVIADGIETTTRLVGPEIQVHSLDDIPPF